MHHFFHGISTEEQQQIHENKEVKYEEITQETTCLKHKQKAFRYESSTQTP